MLHNPRANATPSQLEAWRERDERLQKMKPPQKVFVPEPEEVPALTQWMARQCEINPIQKAPWFTIDEDLGPVELVRIKIDDIQRVVSKYFDISRNDLIASRRTADLVRARQVAVYLAKKLTPRSLPEIGRRFGGRDHSTILHGVRKIDLLRRSDEKLENDLQAIALLLGAQL